MADRIGHDSKGLGASWHLNKVVIESLELCKRWTFACNRWLDKNEGDRLTHVELFPIDNNDYETDDHGKRRKTKGSILFQLERIELKTFS